MSVYDFKLHELQSLLNSFAIEEASKAGKKVTFGIRLLAQGVGVDYATMKGFVYGTIKKPSERTLGRIYAYLQKMDDWVINGSDDPVTELAIYTPAEKREARLLEKAATKSAVEAIATPAEKREARLREKASTEIAIDRLVELNKNEDTLDNDMLKTEMTVLHNRIVDLEEDLREALGHRDSLIAQLDEIKESEYAQLHDKALRYAAEEVTDLFNQLTVEDVALILGYFRQHIVLNSPYGYLTPIYPQSHYRQRAEGIRAIDGDVFIEVVDIVDVE